MASNISIAVGQCGLQVCDATLNIVHRAPDYQDISSTSSKPYENIFSESSPTNVGTVRRASFHPSGRARAIFVDSEPRVLSTLQTNASKPWICSQGTSCVNDTSGRGNNWAQGYLQSSVLVAKAMESVRKEVEACDWYRGCTLYHALGGGTGSGTGTRIARAVRDQYSKCNIASICIAPSASYESPVYGYNTVLSLWQLQQHADAICMFTNDDLHQRAQRAIVGNQEDQNLILPKRGKVNRDPKMNVQIPLQSLNNQCAISVAGMVYPSCLPVSPASSSSTPSSSSSPFSLYSPFRSVGIHDTISNVVPVNDLKYIDIRSSIYSLPSDRERSRRRLKSTSTDSWTRTAKLLMKAIPKFDVENERIQTLHQNIIVKGDDDGVSTQSPWSKSGIKITKRILSTLHPVSWNLDAHLKEGRSMQCVSRSSMDAFDGRSMTCISNRTAAASLLRRLHNKTGEMFSANAYVHWYEEHGCDRDIFVEAFESCARTVSAYRAASQREARGAFINVLETPTSIKGGSSNIFREADPYDVLMDENVNSGKSSSSASY